MTPGTLPDAWSLLLRELRTRLEALNPGQSLNLAEAVSTVGPQPPTGLLARFRAPRPAPVRYVQFLAFDDGLVGEAVGPAYWPSTPEQQSALVAAGWAEPETVPGFASGNFVRSWEGTHVEEAATEALQALVVLGADPTRDWSWEQITL